MNQRETSEYLDFLDDFQASKQSKKFKRAFLTIARKITYLHKRYPNSLEYDFLDDALEDIKDFRMYAHDVIFDSMSYATDAELRLSGIVDENDKYAKILSCLGVIPILYYTISEETLDFVIDNYSQIGMLTIEQLVDIDLAYTVCLATFKDPPKDYNQLKRTFNFIQKKVENEDKSGIDKGFPRRLQKVNRKLRDKRKRR